MLCGVYEFPLCFDFFIFVFNNLIIRIGQRKRANSHRIDYIGWMWPVNVWLCVGSVCVARCSTKCYCYTMNRKYGHSERIYCVSLLRQRVRLWWKMLQQSTIIKPNVTMCDGDERTQSGGLANDSVGKAQYFPSNRIKYMSRRQLFGNL